MKLLCWLEKYFRLGTRIFLYRFELSRFSASRIFDNANFFLPPTDSSYRGFTVYMRYTLYIPNKYMIII